MSEDKSKNNQNNASSKAKVLKENVGPNSDRNIGPKPSSQLPMKPSIKPSKNVSKPSQSSSQGDKK